MGDLYYSKELGRKSATGVGTNAGTTQTVSGATGKRWHPVGIQCSGDAAAVVTVEHPAGTVIWRKRFAAAFVFSEAWGLAAFDDKILSNTDTAVKISTSTSNCEANIQVMGTP